ncbi:MAG: YajQ family cyclic di-GMP-binding protein [Gammaproteobacteria bacterium]|nr:YajQ family cyclic di-GMP-binding protein [Gammaproteobacteria bacterium]
MPSFDVVSEVDEHELTNAVDQINREVTTRFDFKGSDAKVEMKDKVMSFDASSSFQLQQMRDIMANKFAKRGIDNRCLDRGLVEERGMRAYQTITVKQGLNQEDAKKVVKAIKGSKIKVQAAIQGDQVRVTGKKRDDLQAVMTLLKSDIDLPLQFNNFRD